MMHTQSNRFRISVWILVLWIGFMNGGTPSSSLADDSKSSAPSTQTNEGFQAYVAEPNPPTRSELARTLPRLRPQWGVQFTGSPNATGGGNANSYFATKGYISSGDSNPAMGSISLLVEYQPAFLQSLGVLSLGPTLSIYPMFPYPSTFQSGAFSSYSYGGQVRYQLRYFQNQILVPVVGYFAENYHYSFLKGDEGTFLIQGPTAGLWLFLNSLEPSAARTGYIDIGIQRSYLTFEIKQISGGDGKFAINGLAYYFGIRSEF